MNILLEKLHTVWWNEDKRICGENPACDRWYNEIQAKLETMSEDEISAQLETMSDLQLEEILPVMDSMVDDHPQMRPYIERVMST